MSNPNVDLSSFRNASNIDCNVVRDWLWAGFYEKHHRIVQILSSERLFDKSKGPFLQRSDQFKHGLAMMNRLSQLREIHKWSEQEFLMATTMIDETIPLSLHLRAFQPVVLSQGSPDQVADIGERARNLAIIGAYAQTELGHGSNITKLETTATYLPDSQQFEISSGPTLTSSKWWVGGLGKTATHAVVQARLIMPGGVDKGPHLFVVQLRSLDDHKILEGIKLGDIGPKAFGAFASLDNGYARFDKVRVARTAMLSKFAQVNESGNYVQPPHAKLSYGGMIYIRSNMIVGCGLSLAKGITIGIRYCTVRRQGTDSGSGEERQVISYPSVYVRLLPILSQAYVFILLGRDMINLFSQMSSKLSTGDTSLLAETHAVSSGLKSFVTRQAADSLAITRAALGGHGYSAFAGVGRIWGELVPGMTYEGDNYVLDQQVVRAALKAYQRLAQRLSQSPGTLSKSDLVSFLGPSTSYLRHLSPSAYRSTPKSLVAQWNNPAFAVEILEKRAALMVQSLANDTARKSNPDTEDAGVRHRISFAVTDAYIAGRLLEILRGLPNSMDAKSSPIPTGRNTVSVVSDLILLYLLTTTEKALSDILELSLLDVSSSSSISPVKSLRSTISSICITLLPEAVGLSDAFGFTDWELDSALGVFDGNVYEELWKRAQEEPLNAQTAKEDLRQAYQDSIKPILERGTAKYNSRAKGKL